MSIVDLLSSFNESVCLRGSLARSLLPTPFSSQIVLAFGDEIFFEVF